MEGTQYSEAVVDNGKYGQRVIRFETGRLAKQAAGAAMTYLDGDTAVFSTTTASKQPREGLDFFPLTIDVEERMYAVGRIPGSFFRREGRPSTEAILTARLIDRPLRPAFVSGLRNEIQVVATIMAVAPGELYDVVAINSASMSTQLAGLPFSGPIGAVRVVLLDDQWIAFPTDDHIKRAVFDMVVAGRVVVDEDGNEDVSIMMVEAEAPDDAWSLIKESSAQAPTEEIVASGLEEAKTFIHVLCRTQNELAGKINKGAGEFPVFKDYEEDVYKAVEELAEQRLNVLMTVSDKQEREAGVEALTTDVLEVLAGEGKEFEGRDAELNAALRSITKGIVRRRILTEEKRIDGRGLSDIRPLSAEVGVLPRVHGSAIFERGETQILGVTTLNMLSMSQELDSLMPDTEKRYLHHYNFPPYSTGETGRVGSPKRREIGHGALAERALVPVLPSREDFPYAIREVSEALSSNGSTSMGSVCASSLAMLNAGVPLKAPVAGIAMGLVSDVVDGEARYAALTDILGAEDAFGDMDFKVAGTDEFVTAIQLDTKLDGIPAPVLTAALNQAREARLKILSVMNEAIDGPGTIGPTVSRIITVNIPVDKIGEVIGPKGKMIKEIQEQTGAEINIEENGIVYIGAPDVGAAEAARALVNAIANPSVPELGERYLGTVVKIMDFGAFISLVPGKDGLLHISELKKLNGGNRVDEAEDILRVGQKVSVEVAEINDRGKLSLALVV